MDRRQFIFPQRYSFSFQAAKESSGNIVAKNEPGTVGEEEGEGVERRTTGG